ncbi:MAG: hypothetical protein K1X38_15505 [Microthrixaceae bacterium]|nr:hypothetical protein [Microthrixaceae bacterium]
MRRSNAVRHLVEMSEVATEKLDLRNTDFGWALEELWVTADLLSLADTMESGSVVLVLDLPTTELPWAALHPVGEWIGEILRLGKRPLEWCYRPLAWPAWNHEHRRVARFWSATDGLDAKAIEALQLRRLDRVAVVEPSTEQLVAQLNEELPVSRRHLKTIVDRYWDHNWRRALRGHISPEDHLWRAASAVEDMLSTLDELTNPEPFCPT